MVATPHGKGFLSSLPLFVPSLCLVGCQSWSEKVTLGTPFPFFFLLSTKGLARRMSIDPPLQGLDYFDHFVLVCSLNWKVTCFLSPKHRDRFSGKINVRGFCFLFLPRARERLVVCAKFKAWRCMGEAQGLWGKKRGVETDHATLLAMVESTTSQIM